MIAKEQRKELRRLVVQATAGHWVTDGAGGVVAEDDQLNGGYFIAECGGPGLDGNSRFIAAASPEVVLALLDRLDEVEPLVEACEFLGKANRARNGGATGAFRDGINMVIEEEQKLSGLPFEERDNE